MKKKGEIKPINRRKFYNAILEAFTDCDFGLTAYETSLKLKEAGIIPYAFRQAVHPRMTELLKMGELEVVGKAYDSNTHKSVSVYQRCVKSAQKGGE